MKKIISILLASVLILTMLCSCGSETTALTIEDHTWTFTVLQDSGGGIIACSADNQELYENVIVAEFTAVAADGKLTLADTATSESYEVAYAVESENPESTIYTISDATTNEAVGQATVAITEYDDGSSEYTLIISSNGYAIYFIETIE